MTNIGEETGAPWEEPAPQEWELPGYPVPTAPPAPAEPPATPSPVTIPAGTLRPGERIRLTSTGRGMTCDLYIVDEAWGTCVTTATDNDWVTVGRSLTVHWRLLGTIDSSQIESPTLAYVKSVIP